MFSILLKYIKNKKSSESQLIVCISSIPPRFTPQRTVQYWYPRRFTRRCHWYCGAIYVTIDSVVKHKARFYKLLFEFWENSAVSPIWQILTAWYHWYPRHSGVLMIWQSFIKSQISSPNSTCSSKIFWPGNEGPRWGYFK